MKLKNISLTLLLLSFTIPMIAQQWVEEMNDPDVNFYQVQKTFYDTWADKEYTKGNGYKQFKRYEYFMAPRVYPDGIRNNTPNLWEEVSNFEKLYGTVSTTCFNLLTSFVMFAFLSVLNGEQLSTNDGDIVPPL